MAYQMLEDDLCPSCSVPVWLGHSTLGEIEFKIHQTTCYSCAEKDAFSSKKKNEAGSSEWVEVVIADGMPYPSRSEGFKTFEDRALHVGSEQGTEEEYEEEDQQ